MDSLSIPMGRYTGVKENDRDVEDAGRYKYPLTPLGNMQVLGRSLEIAMAEQELNAARIDAGIEQGAWQTSGAARLLITVS